MSLFIASAPSSFSGFLWEEITAVHLKSIIPQSSYCRHPSGKPGSFHLHNTKNNMKFTCSPLSDLLYFGSASLRHHFGGSTSKPLAPSAPPVQQRPCSSSSISCVSCIMQPVPSSKWKCLSEQRAGQRFRVTSDSWERGEGPSDRGSTKISLFVTGNLLMVTNIQSIPPCLAFIYDYISFIMMEIESIASPAAPGGAIESLCRLQLYLKSFITNRILMWPCLCFFLLTDTVSCVWEAYLIILILIWIPAAIHECWNNSIMTLYIVSMVSCILAQNLCDVQCTELNLNSSVCVQLSWCIDAILEEVGRRIVALQYLLCQMCTSETRPALTVWYFLWLKDPEGFTLRARETLSDLAGRF